MLGYFDEPARARETLDRRYDDLKSGNYIAQDNPEAVDQVMVEIFDRLRGPGDFPKPRATVARTSSRGPSASFWSANI